MSATTVKLNAQALRVTATLNQGALGEVWELKQGAAWKTILKYSGPRIIVAPAAALVWNSLAKQGSRIVASGAAGNIAVQRIIELDGLRAQITHSISSSAACQLTSYEDVYILAVQNPDFVWAQELKRADGDFVAHWMFKVPAVIYQTGKMMVALVPDLTTLSSDVLKKQPVALDLANDGAAPTMFSYGICPNKLTSHSIYGRAPETPLSWDGAPLTLDHALQFGVDQAANQGFRAVVQGLWSDQGSPALRAHPEAQQNIFFTQYNTFQSWASFIWTNFAQQYYREYDDPGGTIATLIIERNIFANKEGTNNDGWYNAWFQQLRTALGMWMYGARTANARLQQQGRYVLDLALGAPRDHGLFPTIFWRGDDGSNNWFRSDGWAGFRDSYHAYDMTWTGYWMLRWLALGAPDETRILPICTALADFLITHIQPNGCVPSWFNADLTPRSELLNNNAETGCAALYFAELYAATKQSQYLDAAKRTLGYLRDSVFPAQRWYDFEAFLSCSPKPFDFTDPRTRQIPHNNLCTISTALAAIRIYEQTNDGADLDFAKLVGDYLSLTQAVFTHPLLTPRLIAGFTVQNSDGEWNDARQAYAADFYFSLYEHTGTLEYLERAVGALRASFPVGPFENYAHDGSQDIYGAFTGLHWGLGSGMTSVEQHLARYHEAYINIRLGHGIGVDGCSLYGLIILPFIVRFELASPFSWADPPLVVIDEAPTPLAVFANGKSLGIFTPAQLKQGIPVPLTGAGGAMAQLVQNAHPAQGKITT